jgi:hypothetical protein
MVDRWVGTRRVAFIPAIVNDTRYPPAFRPPPPEWAALIKQRLYFDPDPVSGLDRSLRTYYHTISYGRASLDAHVFEPVVVAHSHCAKQTDDAINATPGIEQFEYACVVFTGGAHPCDGWAFYRNPPFYFSPHRPGTNHLQNWCYLSMDAPLGVWAMELLHCITAFGDLYNTTPHPGGYDEMACNCGTHPSTYTKLSLGWLDPTTVTTFTGANGLFTLHALALLQPPTPGRVAGVMVPSVKGTHYYLLEARLRVDAYERQTANVSTGIPAEGVVVYEVHEDDPIGSPLRLRTPVALNVGQALHLDEEALEIQVLDVVPGGFRISVARGDNPECAALRREIAVIQQEVVNLETVLRRETDLNRQKVTARLIEGKQAQLRSKQERAQRLNCPEA